MQKKQVVVVGAGPAGMMAAIRASELKSDVFLIEKNPTLGKKLLLSGKGRCNLTNACAMDEFLSNFSHHGQFLRDAFGKFFNQDLIDFFEKRGLGMREERQRRIFPVSDRSASVLNILKNELDKRHIKLFLNNPVKDILVKNCVVCGVHFGENEFLKTNSLILATGGVSYKFTGSTGEVFNLLKKLGHTIIELKPGLVPLIVSQNYPSFLEGLVLKNICLEFVSPKSRIISQSGELLFTGTGISGPLVLSLSGKAGDLLRKDGSLYVNIDLKPALSIQQLENRLLREFNINSNKSIRKIMGELLPLRLIDLFIRILGFDPRKKANQVTANQRRKFAYLLKSWRLDICATSPLDQAMITRGGVSLKEINPRTMESRLIKGLYFAGEMIDIDADTGGFNLQAAFSTGYLAGGSAALS
ncbi:MAG: NAD(P)/FAD-dependent oxidoreductase [Candidatus Omnitrophota bacterium]|nr:NAD(P)/FAD-dependent oxidoreductase [Candidatus Omnitrophota bacterium]